MPIYEYACTACGHSFDTLQKISEAPLTDCPACAQASLQKMVSASSFQLKGTGWYATDFKNKPQSETKTAVKSEDSSGSTSASSTSSTDTKS